MRNKMTAWGVGRKLAGFPLKYYALTVILHILMPSRFFITKTPHIVFPVKGELLTTGIYAFVRHPMYSGMVFFISPGIALCFRFWLLLTPSLLAYVLFRILIKEEDTYLEQKFGQAFLDHKSRVNAIIPFIRLPMRYRKTKRGYVSIYAD
jgi:protein-S-isoprenylcysteine O-methyltransferase Ste14